MDIPSTGLLDRMELGSPRSEVPQLRTSIPAHNSSSRISSIIGPIILPSSSLSVTSLPDQCGCYILIDGHSPATIEDVISWPQPQYISSGWKSLLNRTPHSLPRFPLQRVTKSHLRMFRPIHGLKDVTVFRHSNYSNTNPIVAWLQRGTRSRPISKENQPPSKDHHTSHSKTSD
jgi:hypothetical protein